MLENLLNEKDVKLGELALEAHELRDSSLWLAAKLESMISLNERLAQHQHRPPATDLDETLSERERSQLVEQLKELRLKQKSRTRTSEMLLVRDAQQRLQAPQVEAGGAPGGPANGSDRRARGSPRPARRHSLLDELGQPGAGSPAYKSDTEAAGSGNQGSASRPDVQQDSSEWMADIFALLRKFQAALQQRKEAIQSNQLQTVSGQQNDDSGISADEGEYTRAKPIGAGRAGTSVPTNVRPIHRDPMVYPVLDRQRADSNQWRQLLSSLKALIEEMVSSGGSWSAAVQRRQLGQLQLGLTQPDAHHRPLARPPPVCLLAHHQPCTSCQLMIGERAGYEQLQKVHAKLADELRKKNDEVAKLSAECIEQGARLGALEQKCQLLHDDLENCDKPKEEIVRLAWKARDEAVARKNAAEISLAKTRIENMQISSQLMEVVQQKGELSQKLAQFEVSFRRIDAAAPRLCSHGSHPRDNS